MKIVAREIKIEGVVQGVGFRPTVFRIAQRFGIKGWVLNSSEGVTIWAEASEETINSFYRELLAHPPKLAIIMNHHIRERQVKGYDTFFINRSQASQRKDVVISPDVSICDDCYREIMDPTDRRYHYPFTNCTNCGPRFTIIMDIPYDRVKTTMRDFPMCPTCQHEFDDPTNRRFDAQPNACPNCGPRVTLRDRRGHTYPGLGHEFLKQGKILAVKGLGGYHLVCDATNRESVVALRKRKVREFKPFAVMCRDTEVVRQFCHLSPEEEKLMESPAHPIVILDRLRLDDLPPEIAPGIATLGVMLPYTPLHHLLFADGLEILVMTSANISDDPLIIDNEEAIEKLAGIADYFLTHNRRIYNRCDDSVSRVVRGEPQITRRARGYVPLPIDLPEEPGAVILGCGGELKSTFCMTKGKGAVLSQHLGDINHYGNYQQFLYTIPRFIKMLNVKPEVIAYDLHPEYMATRWAKEQQGLPLIGVQHHHAHMASTMAENLVTGPALGVICDGTGYGLDGAIWGCEFFAGPVDKLERWAHLDYIPLPGEVTIKRPERMAWTYLYRLFGERGIVIAERHLNHISAEEARVLRTQLDQGINTVPTSSCGRLFDAVSAFLGVCSKVQYEGQAAIELETIADPEAKEPYPFGVDKSDKPWRVMVAPTWKGIIGDLERGVPVATIAGRFHHTVAEMIREVLRSLRLATGLDRVALSGGVFQNRLLFTILLDKLREAGFQVLYHRKVPTNDGGISLGQVYIASEVIKHVSCHTGQNHRN